MRPYLVMFAAAACSQIPDEVRHPLPEAVLIRVLGPSTCHSTRCDSLNQRELHRGALIFADADSLVIADRITSGRVAVREGPGFVIEMYRGQRVTSESVAGSAARSGLLGLATGFLTAATGVVVGELLGLDGLVEESIKTGLVVGAASGVAAGMVQGARDGEAVWQRITIPQLRQEVCRCAHP